MKTLLLTLLLGLAVLSPALAGGGDAVWEGYLFQDGEGRVRVGWPVIAMGVMAEPPHVVRGDLAKRLDPLLSKVGDDWYFWNYDLPKQAENGFGGAPRVLVRIRGTERRPEERGYSAPVYLDDPRLLSVEFLSVPWLSAWTGIFRDKRSSFRIDTRRGPITEEEKRGFAPVALEVLLRMNATPGPGEAERKIVAAIDPRAEVVTDFRTRTGWNIQRWILATAETLDLDLDGLDRLPPLPPGTTDIQRWFLESESKAGFLTEVAKHWKGELRLLRLAHYVTRGDRTVYTLADLEEVSDGWTDEEFCRRLKATRVILSE